ncbi:MAG: siphovirus Gp157 family protein [Oscillospiraceae bacterium]
MTIYDIEKEIYNLVDEETGEIKDFEALENLQLKREEKIENIALWIKDLKADADKIKFEKDKLADREKACKNKAEGLTKLLNYILCGDKFESPRTTITYRKSTKCVIDDEILFIKNHPEFVTETVVQKISLTDITKALKNEIVVDGAELVENSNLQIK